MNWLFILHKHSNYCLQLFVNKYFFISLVVIFKTNVNAELTTNLQREQHLNAELAAKVSEIGVELEEKRTEVYLLVFIFQ